jgi:hypothetical protein
MMPRYRYDKDMECLVEIRDGANYVEEKPKGPTVISDMQPYRAAGSDIACGGKRPMISGRRQHREFLARNGYTEVGNEMLTKPSGPSEKQQQADIIHDIKRAAGDYGLNTGADAARYHQMRQRQDGG